MSKIEREFDLSIEPEERADFIMLKLINYKLPDE